eukprot:scaffold71842_cov33-Tisochrysis_lutea.AAC.3
MVERDAAILDALNLEERRRQKHTGGGVQSAMAEMHRGGLEELGGGAVTHACGAAFPTCSRSAARSGECLVLAASRTIQLDASLAGGVRVAGSPYHAGESYQYPCSRNLMSFHGSSCRRIQVACSANGRTLACAQSRSTSCVSVLQNCAAGSTAPVTLPSTRPHMRFPVRSRTGKSVRGCLLQREQRAAPRTGWEEHDADIHRGPALAPPLDVEVSLAALPRERARLLARAEPAMVEHALRVRRDCKVELGVLVLDCTQVGGRVTEPHDIRVGEYQPHTSAQQRQHVEPAAALRRQLDLSRVDAIDTYAACAE